MTVTIQNLEAHVATGLSGLATLLHVLRAAWVRVLLRVILTRRKASSMSETAATAPTITTTVVTPAPAAPDLATSIDHWSAWAFQAFEKAGAVWREVQASPIYPVIKNTAIDFVKSEIGAPAAASLVSVDAAVEAKLNYLAALSEKVSVS